MRRLINMHVDNRSPDEPAGFCFCAMSRMASAGWVLDGSHHGVVHEGTQSASLNYVIADLKTVRSEIIHEC